MKDRRESRVRRFGYGSFLLLALLLKVTTLTLCAADRDVETIDAVGSMWQ
jgi:hypothetical protein